MSVRSQGGPAAAAIARAGGEAIVADGLDWSTHSSHWPNADASRFVTAGGVRWHVQVAGRGPAILLVHGTAASAHSWRDLLPLLAERLTVVAPDLPGHGFTSRPAAFGMSLPGMAKSLDALLRALDVRPVVAVGHSAGAAVLARMVLDRTIAPARLVSVNGALLPLHGLAGLFFAPMARTLTAVPLVPRFVAARAARPGAVERLLRDTGSTIDARGTALYRALCANASHIEGALAMMANWDLDPLERDLPRLGTTLQLPLVLLVAANDRAVTPRYAARTRALVPTAVQVDLPGLGHLAHEERPAVVAAHITRGIADVAGRIDDAAGSTGLDAERSEAAS